MALPAFTKTWQFDTNNSIPAAADTHDHYASFYIDLVRALTGFSTLPWEVSYSCNGTTAGTPGDGVDRIGSTLSNWVTTTGASSARSWIVLVNPTTGMEFMISGQGSFNGERPRVSVSWADGFTGGSTTSDPSATDEEQIYTGDDLFGLGNPQRDAVYNYMHSEDGKFTYIFANIANVCPLFIYLGEPENATAGWTNPLVAGCLADDGNTPEFWPTHVVVLVQDEFGFTGGVTRMRANLTGGTIPIYTSFTCPAMGDATSTPRLWGETQGGSNYVPGANDISGEWTLPRVGLVCYRQSGVNGYHGRLPDLHFGQDPMSEGDTFPGDGSKTRRTFGMLVAPWNGVTPVTA